MGYGFNKKYNIQDINSFCRSFNLCLVHSYFPNKMKMTIIKPIYRGNDKNKIINYRPISLLPQIGKKIRKHIILMYYVLHYRQL